MRCTEQRPQVQAQTTQGIRITVARSANLPPSAKLLLRTLVDYMGQKEFCWPSMNSLAAELCLTIQHVRRLVRCLEAHGFIQTEARFRSDGSQASNVFRWSWVPPNLDVPPPEHPSSPLKHPGNNSDKHHASVPEECELLLEKPKTKPQKPAQKPTRQSKRFIEIDGSKFRDPQEAKRVYEAAVLSRLINSGTIDQCCFYACWLEVVAKHKAGKVNHPERLMRFLLNDRRIMGEYPTAESETRARQLINHLYRDAQPAYSPHGLPVLRLKTPEQTSMSVNYSG